MQENENENEVTFEVEFNEPEEKLSWWKTLPIINMFYRYKNDEELKSENGINKLP